MTLRFQKFQATGNDFVALEHSPTELSEAQRRLICDRHFGIGADGMIHLEALSLVSSHRTGIFRLGYWNADGRPGTFCGNGARAAAYLAYQRWGVKGMVFLASDGAHEAYVLQVSPPLIAVQLTLHQPPRLVSENAWFVHTGSPHLMIEKSAEELETLPINEIAPPLRWERKYDPEGVNVSFFASQEDGSWALRTYERGVEAETLSCGTACIALAAIQAASETFIQTRGGRLIVQRRSSDTFWLIGPTELTLTGEYHGLMTP
ncbi:MAG: diaminopimelate epimerase [Bacteroidia bacterium]|nr:diaminopimelate epimerase [Bacteroidia bacterium]